MKMVLVFDTDDRDGMKSCLKIFKQLAEDNGMLSSMANMNDPRFGKIEFIKMLKDFDAFCQSPDAKRNPNTALEGGGNISLRTLKEFADHVFNEKSTVSYYKPKWIRNYNK
jgi:hypothetical protein